MIFLAFIGKLKNIGDDAQPTEQGNGKAMTGQEIIAIKDNQIVGIPQLVIA